MSKSMRISFAIAVGLFFLPASMLGIGKIEGAGQAGKAVVRKAGSEPLQVLTHRYDTQRTGANLQETTLNESNVNVGQFGKIFSRQVDGFIYAQPLYVSGLEIAGRGTRNVVFVATQANNVYAFDADRADAKDPLWKVNLGTPMPSEDIVSSYLDLIPQIGITSTPVIDLPARTIYVVAKSKDQAGKYHQKLHALDITTGQDRSNSPMEITAQVAGTGAGNVNGIVRLDPKLNLNRPGLLLLNGVVYVAFGSHGGVQPYHGWLLGYDAKTLQQVAVFCSTPDGSEGSIWQSGQGLAADAESNIYVVTGNGTFNAAGGGRNYGDSAIKLSTKNGLSVTDYYTPYNEADLYRLDADLGSGGPVLLPGANRMIFTGKDTVFRILDTKNLGRYNSKADQIVQRFQPSTQRLFGAPVYWDTAAMGKLIYYWGGGDALKAFQFIDGRFREDPVMQASVTSIEGVSSAPPMTLSANGNQPESGILWATAPVNADPNQQTTTGILRAFDATDLRRELWNSRQNAARDDIGNFAKFCPPVVANGKVYVATFSGQLHVFGSLSTACNFSLARTGQIFSAGAETASVGFKAGAGCNWVASTNESWIDINGGEGFGDGTLLFSVEPNPSSQMRTGIITVAGLDFTVTQAGAAQMASAASFDRTQLAPESIATVFGKGLSAESIISRMPDEAGGAPLLLPASLGGTTVKVTDGTGAERIAPLFFVSPTQVNFQIPAGTAMGSALIQIQSANGNYATGAIPIERIAPGLFSANATGQGVAVGVALRVAEDQTQSFEPLFEYDAGQRRFLARPIDLGKSTDRVYLILFGTGIRFRRGLEDVRGRIGNVDAPVLYAGAQGAFAGLDQLNLLLPRSLQGRGEVSLQISVEGTPANPVTIWVK